MTDRWIREGIMTLKTAMEKFHCGNEGDFRQALTMADQATESIMRKYLIFVHDDKPPYNYPDLLDKIKKKVGLDPDLTEIIRTFRLIRDGFHHHNIKKLEKGLKGTTDGLTLEKSHLEDYLNAVCKLIKHLTGVEINI